MWALHSPIMFSSKQSSRGNYILIAKRENGDQHEIESLRRSSYSAPDPLWRSGSYLVFIFCGLGVFSLLLIFAYNTAVAKALFPQIAPVLPVKHQGACANPSIRREWRSLGQSDQLQYIAAVQCLRDKPSQLGLNQTLYDDFPWIHSRIGNYCMCLDLLPCHLAILTRRRLIQAHSS